MWWLGLTTGTAIVVTLVVRRFFAKRSSRAELDVGTVSEGWLAEQRGRKD